MEKSNRKLYKVMVVYVIVCVVFVTLFKTIFRLSYIPSESMEGTIQAGDIVVSTCYGIKENDIERYDILIFTSPDGASSETYIKRLIGLPGETIKVSNGKVYADGVELDNSFVNTTMNEIGDGVYIVPEGCYFFLGDNRNNSKDSRFWEKKYVPLENIQAKAKYILFPFTDAKAL